MNHDEVLSAYVDELLRESDAPVAEYARRHRITDPDTVALLQTARLVHRTARSIRADEATMVRLRERILRAGTSQGTDEERAWWQRLLHRDNSERS